MLVINILSFSNHQATSEGWILLHTALSSFSFVKKKLKSCIVFLLLHNCMPLCFGLSNKIPIKYVYVCGHNVTKCGIVQKVWILLQATAYPIQKAGGFSCLRYRGVTIKTGLGLAVSSGSWEEAGHGFVLFCFCGGGCARGQEWNRGCTRTKNRQTSKVKHAHSFIKGRDHTGACTL